MKSENLRKSASSHVASQVLCQGISFALHFKKISGTILVALHWPPTWISSPLHIPGDKAPHPGFLHSIRLVGIHE